MRCTGNEECEACKLSNRIRMLTVKIKYGQATFQEKNELEALAKLLIQEVKC